VRRPRVFVFFRLIFFRLILLARRKRGALLARDVLSHGKEKSNNPTRAANVDRLYRYFFSLTLSHPHLLIFLAMKQIPAELEAN
jgi:hypothetical protein